MAVKKCIGCGIELQSIDPTKEGYLPSEKMKEGGDLYCQRCFKIKNYGKYVPVVMSRDDYKKEVESVAKQCKVAIAIFDIIDFEGSFDDEILDVMREMDSIAVINKLDLIPDEKHPSEVADWVKKRLVSEGIAPLDIAIVSSKTGYGINGIYKKLKHFYPDGVTGMILGVTNVGKSSIVNKLLGSKRITESKYPGTTLKSIKIRIPDTNIDLIDTPGLIPEGRFSDLVCEECNLKIVPASEISRKTYKVSRDRMIFIERLMWIKVLNDEEIKPIFSIYASKNVVFHETTIEKGMALFNSKDNYQVFKIPCEKCRDNYDKLDVIKKKITVKAGEELVFKGLGWLSVKRGPLNLEIYLPKKANTVIREAFIKPRRK